MALATVAHHSAQPDEALRRQRTARAREVEEQDLHEALRRQMAPPPGMRPGVLQDPAPQGRVGQHSGIGYELILALDVPVLQMAEHPVDASALAFKEQEEKAERKREADLPEPQPFFPRAGSAACCGTSFRACT